MPHRRKGDITLTEEIGATEVQFYIKYSFLPGSPATGPSYASGGEPADPAEIEFESIDWAPISLGGSVGKFKPLEAGALFEIIANDGWFYDQICTAEEANHADDI